jgi:hypothetical protein
MINIHLQRVRRAIGYPTSYLRQRQIIRQHGLPSSILYFNGGVGDQLLLTCVARHLRRQGERRVWVATDHAELFANNPDVSHVLCGSLADFRWIIDRPGVTLHELPYAPRLDAEGRDIPPKGHLLAVMCAQAGVRGEIELRPYLNLDASEYVYGRKVKGQVAIQSSGRSARYFMSTKEWYPERFQSVVDRLKSRVDFVQIGQPKDPPLAGVKDLRGKTTLRQAAAVLAASELFVGLVGFPMHLARAVDCPSVIVYGGRELPSQSGYSYNTNLTGQTECSPCWRWNDCPGQHACMDQITVDQVCDAILARLAEKESPTPVDTVVL